MKYGNNGCNNMGQEEEEKQTLCRDFDCDCLDMTDEQILACMLYDEPKVGECIYEN